MCLFYCVSVLFWLKNVLMDLCLHPRWNNSDSIYSLGCNHITNKNPRENIWSFKHWTTGSTGHWSPRKQKQMNLTWRVWVVEAKVATVVWRRESCTRRDSRGLHRWVFRWVLLSACGVWKPPKAEKEPPKRIRGNPPRPILSQGWE